MSNVNYTSDNQRIVAGTEPNENTKRVRPDVTLYWRLARREAWPSVGEASVHDAAVCVCEEDS